MKENAPELRRSSAVSIDSTLKTVCDNLRTKAPYLPIGLCSLSLLITGVEPACDLLESPTNSRFTVTEEEVYVEMKIDPKLFLSSECDLVKLNGLLEEFFSREKACLALLEGIERELPIINSLVIKETHIRILKEFLQKFKKVVDTQKEFYRNMEIHQAAIPLNSREASKTAAALFLAIYDTKQFKGHITALRSLINDWALMDTLLVEYKPICEEKKKELALTTLADDCRYAFGSRVVQIVSRREILAKELLKSLNLTDAEQIQRLLQCYKAIAYVPTCDNLLLSFKQDGYLRPSTLPSLVDAYFNTKRTDTLSHFLERIDNKPKQEAFLKFIAESEESARLQFFMDMNAFFKKKPWYVTDLQLLVPYFSEAKTLRLQTGVLEKIQEALCANDADASAKMKQIVTALIPAIETVIRDLNDMLKAFLAAPDLPAQLSGVVFQPMAKIRPPMLRSENDRQMRNRIATELFKREIKKQIELLEDTDIFHEGCFKGLVDLICQEMLVSLLVPEKDELQFLSRYAKALLEIPYYLMKALPKNFTSKRVNNQSILSYTFCSELDPDETALHVQSLKNCLAKKATEYNTANREFLAQVESVTSVFELFNLVKGCSDPKLYTTLKEDIRRLNNTRAGRLDKREKRVVATTPAQMSRIRAGDKPTNDPGLKTPSNTTPPPSVVAVGVKKEMGHNRPCTPLRLVELEGKTSPDSKNASSLNSSPSKTGFTPFIGYLKERAKWNIKSYTKKEHGKLELCNDARYDFVCVYEKTQEGLIFTAEKDVEQKQWTVAAYSHEQEHVNEMVSAMAKSVNSQTKILNIAISAEADALRLIETYVGAALEHGFLPVVTLNDDLLEPKELSTKLHEKNEELAKTYDGLVARLFQSKTGKISENRNAFRSVRRVLTYEDTLAPQDHRAGFTQR